MSEFQRSIREGDASVPFEVLKDEVLGVARRMVENDPSIGAIVCECTNITPYSHELNRRLGVPVLPAALKEGRAESHRSGGDEDGDVLRRKQQRKDDVASDLPIGHGFGDFPHSVYFPKLIIP